MKLLKFNLETDKRIYILKRIDQIFKKIKYKNKDKRMIVWLERDFFIFTGCQNSIWNVVYTEI